MNTFASELSFRIKSNALFWGDMENACSIAIRSMLSSSSSFFENTLFTTSELSEESTSRLLQSASILAQSTQEPDKRLAQDIALYLAVASSNQAVKSAACDILGDIGNHPGAEYLREKLNAPNITFISTVRTHLLRFINEVTISGKSYAFTDFQHKVWSALPESTATAISAPTSAGKSLVVLEYLCQQAIKQAKFTAVFITPTRALLSEVHAKISARLAEHASSVRISTIPTLDSENRTKQIFVLTQERLQVLLSTWNELFDLVVVDEAQSIGEGSRGMILQDCIELIQSQNTSTKYLFLAPGASGFNSMANAINVSSILEERTDLSPVIQNRITVQSHADDSNCLSLSLLTEDKSLPIGILKSKRGFGNANTRLAAVALELGSNGGSLVYGTGAADAESVSQQIASDLKQLNNPQLHELSDFIKTHVHPKYSLSQYVLKGVGYHYGKMPSLLRDSIEEAFKESHIKYLVCTTTLFQGVNLPARNVFIDTPTRGHGNELEPSSLWNFAGRAGRLGKDIVGNVFLVGYDNWDTKPLSTKADFEIKPSFKRAIVENVEAVLLSLKDDPLEGVDFEVRKTATAAAGLLISHAARDTLGSFIERALGDELSHSRRQQILEVAAQTFKNLELPPLAVRTNWTVNPFGQARLLKRIREKILAKELKNLIPIHPAERSSDLFSIYVSIFSRINKALRGKSVPQFDKLLAGTSLDWMSGKPLPVIISQKIAYREKKGPIRNYDSVIRKAFEFVEDILRFQYVQYGRAYVDLLRFALNEANLEREAKGIYDFSLALELGVSTPAGQTFIELGLSRIAAAALEGKIPDSNPSPVRAKEWLAGITEQELNLSKVIWGELLRKELVKTNSQR